MNSPKILYIEWEDHSSSHDSSWKPPESFDTDSVLCVSVGRVVAEDANAITLCGTWSPGYGHGDQTILKRCIKKRRVLRST
jgi:hypothetical protein